MTQLWATNDYTPRDSQDCNQIYSNSQASLPTYSNGNGVQYLDNDGNTHYSGMTHPYSSFPTPFVASQHTPGALMYMQTAGGAASMPYQIQPPPSSTLPSQPRTVSQHTYYSSSMLPHRATHQQTRPSLAPDVSLADTEDQESPNNDTMRSEPVSPPLDGYPNVADFDELMRGYIENLSPKKRDKALIHAKRAANIKAVLVDKKTTSIESAQFRFWVKKMFTLEPKDSTPQQRKKICHEGKPVAIREKLFKILTRAHKQCQHGGRDKTSAQVRRVYSWVPKELISRFVKLCPTCQIRRGTNRTSPSESDASTTTFLDPQSPIMSSTNPSRRQSLAIGMVSSMHSPPSLSRYASSSSFGQESSIFQQQNRWMTSLQPLNKMDRVASLETAASAMVNMNMNGQVVAENLTSSPSKFAEDPGTPYFTSQNLQNAAIGPAFQHNSFSSMPGLQSMHHSNDAYRLRHCGSALKRESRYQ